MHVPHLATILFQAATDAAQHVPAKHVGWFKHFTTATSAFFQRYGIWGLAAIALLDSALLPMPWQVLLLGYVAANPSRFMLYPVVAAIASSIGSLVPYYIGRLGGEIFLLGKINRERYESLRDRFERQEFLAILIPAIGPPPTPFKLFEFCAGVFEMKPLPFVLAALIGKLIQYSAYALITHYYGPGALAAVAAGFHHHTRLVFWIVGLFVVLLAVWLVRKLFDRRKGSPLPIEEQIAQNQGGKHTIVEE